MVHVAREAFYATNYCSRMNRLMISPNVHRGIEGACLISWTSQQLVSLTDTSCNVAHTTGHLKGDYKHNVIIQLRQHPTTLNSKDKWSVHDRLPASYIVPVNDCGYAVKAAEIDRSQTQAGEL